MNRNAKTWLVGSVLSLAVFALFIYRDPFNFGFSGLNVTRGVGTSSGGTDTLLTITNRGNVATSSVILYGGLTTSDLTATGTTDIQGDMTFADATGTSLFATTGGFTSAYVTGGMSVGGLLGLSTLTFTHATGTSFHSDVLCLTGDDCITAWPVGGGTDDQTWQETLAQGNVATSSFLTYGNGTTTNFYATGTFGVFGDTTLANATGTSLHSDVLCLTGDSCITTWPTGGSSFDWGLLEYPPTNNTYSLGSATGSLANIYASGTAYIGTDVVVNGLSVCLSDGTNCTASGGDTPQLSQVINAGSSATSTPSFDMGFTASTGTITGDMILVDATSTSLFSTTLGATTLYTTNGLWTSATGTSLEISGLSMLEDITFTGATGTGLDVTSLTATNGTISELTMTNATATSFGVTNLLVGGQSVCLQDGTNCPFASIAETSAGTETAKAITPYSLAGSSFGPRAIPFMLSTSTGSYITTAENDEICFTVPTFLNGWILKNAFATHRTAGSSGTSTQIQVVDTTSSTNMLLSPVHIDPGEKDSIFAVTQPVIDTNNDDLVATHMLCPDVTAVEDTPGKGTVLMLEFAIN